jgi:ABC-type Fe3+-siderophore transport system permease subunit
VNVQTNSESDKVDVGRTFGGVVMSLLGGGALFWGSVLFAFHGVCEDSCDKPPRTLGGTLHVAVPWALGAVALMATAAYLLMSARRSRRPTVVRAVLVGVTSSAVFVAGLWLLVLGTLRNSDTATLFIFGAIVLVCAWQALTIMSARHMARRR